VLEEDLTAEVLSAVDIVYLNGTNIRREALAALAAWVEKGGILYAVSSTAVRDEYDDPLAEAEALFGARQIPGGGSQGSAEVYQEFLTAHEPIDTFALSETALTPAVTLPVVGVKTVLTPTSGEPIAHYADGSCAGVYREVGKGKVLLLGVMPGYLYAHNAPRDADSRPVNYTAERRAVVTKAALSAGPLAVTCSEPLVETVRFDHPAGIAVLVTDVSYRPGRPATLGVVTDREIKEVTASLAGPLDWSREGDTVRIDCRVPAPVDVIVLR